MQPPYPCINSTYSNLEVLHVLQNHWLLDCWFARRLFTNYAFLAGDIKVEKNLKPLLMKATKSILGEVEREILSFINENPGISHHAEQWWKIGVARHIQAWLLRR